MDETNAQYSKTTARNDHKDRVAGINFRSHLHLSVSNDLCREWYRDLQIAPTGSHHLQERNLFRDQRLN